MAGNIVRAEIQYLKRLPLYNEEKPFQIFVPIDANAADTRSTNLEFEAREQQFEDIRGRETKFSLDNDGFQIKTYPTALSLSHFQDRQAVETKYFNEIKQILQGIEGGYDEVFLFDWRLRNAGTPKAEVMFDMNNLTTWLRPSPNVHIDQSPGAVLHRILLHLPEQAEFLLQGRVRVINVWRPIEHPVHDYPLAVCDPRSVPDSDLVECDHVRRKFKGANMYAHYGPGHKWHYLSGQRPDEVLLLKMFDSDPSVEAKACPHASFRHPFPPENSPPRKSIEVRALVFNHP
ncbi:Aspirochlorine biosynthesis protein N [Echria macrotheca]|uniref:Aspirochlorine biosynthesis protein N n=1 Tax=Echria macrotheca TaxID=438768 RepID=A0AAJ0F6F2_9PEZI|nr:Aspirochlorine biosynthesis protein N [Echria macrotheca]